MALEIEKQNRVALVRINHNAANTLTAESFKAIRSSLTALGSDDTIRAVVITGNSSGYFSNGFEPALFLKQSYESNLAICRLVNETALCYFFFPKPIIACLNGHAMGAGAVFALLSDWRMMSAQGARLGFPEALLGMNFPAFVARYMQDLIGLQATRDILFGGKSLKAPDALKIRLVDQVFDDAAILPETMRFAEKLAKSPMQTLVGMKRARTEPYRQLFEALSESDAAALATIVTSPITQEGLLSIVEKRRPRWS
jgi:enoyl-CoA hydratase/carnithine racemase